MRSMSVPEKIMVVENSLTDRDLIARQALRPAGFLVKTAETAATALKLAIQMQPDVIIANLSLPDLSGKDLIVALQSQEIQSPVIMIADEGTENDVIQAFRLGAVDFIRKPLRETEVVAAAERAMQTVRDRREREELARKLRQANQELEGKVGELTTIFSLGKALTSTTSLKELHKIIVDGAIKVTGAHRGYLMTRNDAGIFKLSAYFNLPRSLEGFLDRPMDDGISSLVALSGESLTMSGEPLKRFKIAQIGGSVLVVPVRVQKETVGLLVVIRTDEQPFSSSQQTVLEAVADYASISIANARLFKALEERARSLQHALEDVKQTTP